MVEGEAAQSWFLELRIVYMLKTINAAPETALTPAQDFANHVLNKCYGAVLADPPWRFQNRTGKMAPETEPLLN